MWYRGAMIQTTLYSILEHTLLFQWFRSYRSLTFSFSRDSLSPRFRLTCVLMEQGRFHGGGYGPPQRGLCAVGCARRSLDHRRSSTSDCRFRELGPSIRVYSRHPSVGFYLEWHTGTVPVTPVFLCLIVGSAPRPRRDFIFLSPRPRWCLVQETAAFL